MTTLVIIESPFAGNIERNLKYVRAAMQDCFRRGEAPFASHALYTQPGVLDDNNPAQRAMGIEAGLLWGKHAAKTVVYVDLGHSKGMMQGILAARACGREVEERSLPDDLLLEVLYAHRDDPVLPEATFHRLVSAFVRRTRPE